MPAQKPFSVKRSSWGKGVQRSGSFVELISSGSVTDTLDFRNGGVFAVDGSGGDNYFKRARVFAQLGYRTALLKDSDITEEAHRQQTEACRRSGVTVFEWGRNFQQKELS